MGIVIILLLLAAILVTFSCHAYRITSFWRHFSGNTARSRSSADIFRPPSSYDYGQSLGGVGIGYFSVRANENLILLGPLAECL